MEPLAENVEEDDQINGLVQAGVGGDDDNDNFIAGMEAENALENAVADAAGLLGGDEDDDEEEEEDDEEEEEDEE